MPAAPLALGSRLSSRCCRSVLTANQLDMGFFSNLFGKGEEPVRTFEHPVLGRAEWADNEESWMGEYNGIAYSLAYARMAVPTEQLTQYAVEMLGNKEELLSSVESAKRRAVQKFPAFYHEEIARLELGRVHFYRHRSRRRILADLEGGLDFRAWRIEYHDHICEGIGFDS